MALPPGAGNGVEKAEKADWAKFMGDGKTNGEK